MVELEPEDYSNLIYSFTSFMYFFVKSPYTDRKINTAPTGKNSGSIMIPATNSHKFIPYIWCTHI